LGAIFTNYWSGDNSLDTIANQGESFAAIAINNNRVAIANGIATFIAFVVTKAQALGFTSDVVGFALA
jgi:hypothetical protein